MAITPRYIPGKNIKQLQKEKIELSVVDSQGTGWALNTDEVPDASKITPPVNLAVNSDEELNKVSLRVELDVGFPIEDIQSHYHRISKQSHGEGVATITLLDETEKQRIVKADRDFRLSWETAIGKSPRATIFSEKKNNAHYQLLMIMPPTKFDRNNEAIKREVVYILDTSGSMGGESIRQARKALLLAINKLSAKETFNIIEFNSTARKLFNGSVYANVKNKRKAINFVNSLRANGGTEMAAALNLALNKQGTRSSAQENRVRQVIFLTDGSVGNENNLFTLIKQKLADSRLFTIGIGSAPNHHFMSKAAKFGKGTFTYIGDVSEVQEKMNELFTKLDSPVLKNIKILTNENIKFEAWPKQQPDLYLGEPIIVVSKSQQAIENIKLTAERNNTQWELDLKVSNSNKNNTISKLWARKKIESLMESLHDGASKQKVRQEVTNTAMAHHLVSKYTSLVAVDVISTRTKKSNLHKTAIKTNLPKGMQNNKVFTTFSKTATSAEMDFIKGSVLLTIAMIMLWRQRKENLKNKNSV